jgi:hypothetical protein
LFVSNSHLWRQDDDAETSNEFGDGLSFDDSELESEDTDALFDDDPMYTNRVVTLWYTDRIKAFFVRPKLKPLARIRIERDRYRAPELLLGATCYGAEIDVRKSIRTTQLCSSQTDHTMHNKRNKPTSSSHAGVGGRLRAR